MYQVYCDEYQLYDPRSEDLKLLAARCNLEANTVCEGVLTILHTHPFFQELKPLKSVFEIRQDKHVLFRGRMTNNSRDFHKKLDVDLEGVLGFTNDTIIPPFTLEQGTLTCGADSETYTGDNIVEFFLGWVLDQHNKHVKDWQKLRVGTVKVADPNNNITRSSEDYESTWDILKTRFFESSLGGYLYVRYEDDGNYVDYVDQFELTNTQRIRVGANILDINTTSDADTTYSAILPIGKDGLTLANIPDGDLTEDLVKMGNYIYSKSAVEEYGWICVPLADAKNDDITDADNLKDWAMEYLTGVATYTNTMVIKAVDLSFTDEEIAVVRAYRNVIVDAPTHGIDGGIYPLPKLEIDILNPQNTIITLGDTSRSLIDINRQQMVGSQGQIKEIKGEVQKTTADITEVVKEQSTAQMTQIIMETNTIILSALEDYVETANFEQYKETVSTQLQLLADEILMTFNTTTEHITNVDGDMQNKFSLIYKYISFADGNITLGSSENAITLTVENDMIVFKKNGLQFGWWDGVDFHTGNIIVEVNERAQFGDFAFIPRSDGSLMFLKVGGGGSSSGGATVKFTITMNFDSGQVEEYTVPAGTTWREAVESGVFGEGAYIDSWEDGSYVFAVSYGPPVMDFADNYVDQNDVIEAKEYQCLY
jgi:hypothetical protein